MKMLMVTLARLCNSLSITATVMFLGSRYGAGQALLEGSLRSDSSTKLTKHHFDACRGGNTSGLDPARASQQPKVAQIRIASSAERAPDHSSKSFVTSCSHGSAGARPGLM